jgi:hypothetical protein
MMIKTYLRNERGIAIAVALAILLMLGLIGVAVIRTSVTDMDISKAMTDRSKSFYVADGGLALAVGTMRDNAKVVAVDSVLPLVNADTILGDGHFAISMTNTYPIRTVTSLGHDNDGEAAVAVDMRHRRNPINPWDNVIFAGVGQAGKGIAGNVDVHGSVHILGEGELFTDGNGNGKWDDDDVFTDLNGDGVWQPGEVLTTDSDGDGMWDGAEAYVDDNGNGDYDQTLTATDLSFEAFGSAAIGNNYSGLNATLSSRLPALPAYPFNGENVQSLEAELRVKHGRVNLSGTATVGDPNVSGGSPLVKETMDGVYVNDGYGGTSGTANVYADNGTTEGYDLPDGVIKFPSLNDTSYGYPTHRDFMSDSAAIISGDITLKPGVAYTSPASSKGSISIDANGNMTITGIVLFTGNVYIEAGDGSKKSTPIVYDGKGTLASMGNMHINTHVITKGEFPTDDVLGFLSYQDLEIGTGSGSSQLNLMGAFYAQQQITNSKQNSLVGAMVSNFFNISNVPSLYQVPSLVDNLPPGLPGGRTFNTYIWRTVASTWREL